MDFIVKQSDKEFIVVPPGTYLGACYLIVDLGTQQTDYMGDISFKKRMTIYWEVHGEDENGNQLVTDDGKPYTIFKNYTQSLSEKSNLYKDLVSWRGKQFTQEELSGFNIASILGKWCMLNVIHKPSQDGKKIFANVDGVSPVPSMIKKAGMPEIANNQKAFSLNNIDWDMYETLSPSLKKKIELSPEYKIAFDRREGTQYTTTSNAPASTNFDDMDDDMPF